MGKRGHRVVEASNGQEAIELARTERPGLIVLDLALPVLDGLAVARRVREGDALRDLVIVALTAYILTASGRPPSRQGVTNASPSRRRRANWKVYSAVS